MFQLHSEFKSAGDQEAAIAKLSDQILKKQRAQVLLGITGSGKTFTMANVIQNVQKPTLVLAHNKTLAAQLYQEFKSFFPNSAVEYFVSYYDFYQPEAYIARTDTYIEKDLAINEKIEQMRLAATRALIERKDVIIVASISCIYGLGLPEYYSKMVLRLHKGQEVTRESVLFHLVEMRYERSDYDLQRSTFRARGDVLEIFPSDLEDKAYRVEFFGSEIERLSSIDPLTGIVLERLDNIAIYPGSHYVTPEEVRLDAMESIKKELEERLNFFEKEQKLVEKQRLKERTLFDLEMIKESGFCKGIENYSRHFSGRKAGEPPPCLLDYFPQDFLFIIDESHQSLPQMRAMYNGDRARKQSLVEFGFRLPSAYDNRPLKFDEIFQKINQVVFVSATPAEWEITYSHGSIVEQIIRPTGLLDPEIEIRKAEAQVENSCKAIEEEIQKHGRVLVTTLTKKLAEELTKYLIEKGIKAEYLHSDIDTIERMHLIKELRLGSFDVLVGINLLREGLDIPEVSLIVILDADKEGFLRSQTSLIQTCGRAARNERGHVIMYADKITESMAQTIAITTKRRQKQIEYNEQYHITPKSVSRKVVEDLTETFGQIEEKEKEQILDHPLTEDEIERKIKSTKKEMLKAAKELRFEDAAHFRDLLHYYQGLEIVR